LREQATELLPLEGQGGEALGHYLANTWPSLARRPYGGGACRIRTSEDHSLGMRPKHRDRRDCGHASNHLPT
jgi:hypothetical protein